MSPWGAVQQRETLAPGIEWVSTASHGGILLSPERHAKVRAKFPGFTTWAGGAAYEEDQDVCAVVVTFPEVFPADSVARAQAQITAAADYFKGVRS